jgi:glycosyltransferase involved in cell wall biosynthesis
MMTWQQLYSSVSSLRSTLPEPIVATSSCPKSIALITFRLSTDGVARVIASHIKALRTIRAELPDMLDRIILISGGVDPRYWRRNVLGDRQVTVPALGLKCPTTAAFYSPLKRNNKRYRTLPARIWRLSNALVRRLEKAIHAENVGYLMIHNVNSLPYNIVGALALVMVSERLHLTVLNVCHDFFWEHKGGTRSRLFTNQRLPEVFALVKLLCPWDSRDWFTISTTSATREWLIKRRFKDTTLGVLPYVTAVPNQTTMPPADKVKLITRFNQHLTQINPDAFSLRRKIPFRVSLDPHACMSSIPYVLLVPVKIAGGKRIELALQVLQCLLRTQAFQKLIDEDRTINFMCAGAVYDIPENEVYHATLREAVQKLFADSRIPLRYRQSVSLYFLLGVPSDESGCRGITMGTLYKASDAVVFTSARETWGLPILESAAWGKPLIVTPFERPYRTVFATVTRGLRLLRITPRNIRSGKTPTAVVKGLLDSNILNDSARNNRHVVRKHWTDTALSLRLSRILKRLEHCKRSGQKTC